MRRLPRGANVRRRWRPESMRDRHVHARIVHRGGRRMWIGGRWMRQRHQLRDLHTARHLRRCRSTQSLRRRRLCPTHLYAAEGQLWPSRRWLRQPARLRHVPVRADMRRWRRRQPVWRSGNRALDPEKSAAAFRDVTTKKCDSRHQCVSACGPVKCSMTPRSGLARSAMTSEASQLAATSGDVAVRIH